MVSHDVIHSLHGGMMLVGERIIKEAIAQTC